MVKNIAKFHNRGKTFPLKNLIVCDIVLLANNVPVMFDMPSIIPEIEEGEGIKKKWIRRCVLRTVYLCSTVTIYVLAIREGFSSQSNAYLSLSRLFFRFS
jgi:hypothetical protein